MASRVVNYWRTMAARSGGRGLATATAHADDRRAKFKFKPGYVEVAAALGMIGLSAALGLGTAALQLRHSPNVIVDKKKRETVPEVAAPEWTLEEARHFVTHSLFRKLAQLKSPEPTLRGPLPSHTEEKAVTLKDVGLEPPGFAQRPGFFKNNA